MPAEKIEVVLAHPYDGKAPGDRASYDEQTAIRLVRAGYARYATKAAEKAVEGTTTPAGK